MILRFKDRVMEWWLASCTTLFGLFISLPAESMDSAAFIGLRRMMSEDGWGIFFAVTGALHLLALGINGHAWWTPFVRSAMTAMNTAVYILFGFGIWLVDPYSTGVFSYLVTIGSAAAICFYRATKDAHRAIEAHRYDPKRN